MVEFTHLPLIVAKIASRFFISIEAALGSLILLHLFGKNKWVLKSAFVLLAVFSIYLIWLWNKAGNQVNCGCFGDAIWMTPSTSLLKNILLLIVIYILIRYHKGFNYKWTSIITPIYLIGIVALCYIISPVYAIYKIDLTALYTSDKNLAPAIDLTKGKHIIAFLNPQCMHCRKAALKMHLMKQNNPALPFYLIIGGTTSNLTDFWNASQAQDIPWTRLAQAPFSKYTGNVFPQIFWINNSWVEENTEYPDLDQKAIEKWMK